MDKACRKAQVKPMALTFLTKMSFFDLLSLRKKSAIVLEAYHFMRPKIPKWWYNVPMPPYGYNKDKIITRNYRFRTFNYKSNSRQWSHAWNSYFFLPSGKIRRCSSWNWKTSHQNLRRGGERARIWHNKTRFVSTFFLRSGDRRIWRGFFKQSWK